MNEGDAFSPAIRKQINAAISEYRPYVRGADARLIAGALGISTGKTKERTQADLDRIRASKKYLNAHTSIRAQLIAPAKSGGGSDDARQVQRFFTAVGDKNHRNLLTKTLDGISRLDMVGADYQRATLGVALSDDGISRAPMSATREFEATIATNNLEESLQLVADIEQGRTLMSENTVFGMESGWHNLSIRNFGGVWGVVVAYSIIPSPKPGGSRQDNLDADPFINPSTREFRREQRDAGRQMAASMPARPTPVDAATRLSEFGFIVNLQPVAEGVYTADIGPMAKSWANIARFGSAATGGAWHDRAEGLTWANSKQSLVLIATGNLPYIKNSQRALAVLGGDLVSKPGWSTSKLARQGMAWVMPPGRGRSADEHRHLTADGRWGHVNCYPGRYANYTHWDISGCYYSIARRLQSPLMRVLEGQEPRFGGATTPTACRWGSLLEIIQEDKPLRNTLVGCMATGQKRHSCWRAGEYVEMPDYSTDWLPAGLFIARVGWELCREAAQETRAVLSVTDCVVTNQGRPAVWDRFGLRVKQVATGDAEICTPISFAVGPRETVPYSLGQRGNTAIHHGAKPRQEYYGYLA